MSDKSEKNDYNYSNPPAKTMALHWMIYLVPIFYAIVMCYISRVYDSQADAMKSIFSIPVMIFCAVLLFLVWFVDKKCNQAIRRYNNKETDEKTYRSAWMAYTIHTLFNGGFPIIVAFLCPGFLKMGGDMAGIEFGTWRSLYVNVNAGCLISPIVNTLWLNSYAKWMNFLPIKGKSVRFGISLRVMWTIFCIIWGIYAGVMINVVNAYYDISDANAEQFAIGFVISWLPHLILGLLFSVANMGLVIHYVVNTIKRINKYTDRLAAGDYTVETISFESRDELGLLINNINSMTASTRELLSGVKENVTNTALVGSELHTNMTETDACIQEIISNIGSVTGQVQSQTSVVKLATEATGTIMENINALNQSVENQSASVEQSSAAVKEMVANIQSVTNILQKNQEQSQQLNRATEIGLEKVEQAATLSQRILEESTLLMEASSVIQAIAEQTNLLAMNAAIEAAHAGESGKGFSVVADEIRKLAEQSNTEGKKIAESLSSLEQIIVGVSEATNAVQEQFTDIYTLCEHVNQQEEVVLNAMTEQTEGSKQILEAIKSIDDTTGIVRQGAQEMIEGGKTVVRHMESLGASADNIQNSMSEMSAGTSEILLAVKRVNDTSSKNSTSVLNLQTEMDKFKLTK